MPDKKEVSAPLSELEEMRKHVEHMSKLLVRRDIELMNKNETLKNLDRVKSEFVSIAAHQLRTPLTAIIWASEALLHDESLNASSLQKKSLEDIYESGLRMTELIAGLLNVSRLELGTIEKKLHSYDMSSLTEKVIANFKSAQEKKNITLNVDMQEGEFVTDKSLFDMILSNLLENAIKYTPEDGDVSVSLHHNDHGVALMVKDTGQGIPIDEQKNVFKKFYRASNVSDGTSGTGLGLHIVQMATEKLGGKIHFESELGSGTAFTITLPKKKIKE